MRCKTVAGSGFNDLVSYFTWNLAVVAKRTVFVAEAFCVLGHAEDR